MAKKKLINNYDEGVLIEGSSSKDTLNNYADNVTIDAGAGNDIINNEGSYVSIIGGKGKDIIDAGGGNDLTINGGKSNDTIIGSTLSAEVYQYSKGDGKDVIYGFDYRDILQLDNVSIKKFNKKGDALILKIGSSKVTLKGAADTLIRVRNADGSITTLDNDPVSNIMVGNSIFNRNQSMFLVGTDGNDSIHNYASEVTVNALNGDDRIYNALTVLMDADSIMHTLGQAQHNLIDAGAGSDTIINYFECVTISGGDGNDYIRNDGSNSTIDAGQGNDTIYNNKHTAHNITDSVSYTVNASVTAINGGDGNDSIRNFADLVTIYGGGGDDTIQLYSKMSVVDAGIGKDSVYNNGVGSNIRTNEGNDSITNTSSASMTAIDGGDGDDQIENFAANVTVRGGVGNDTIINNGYPAIINVLLDGGGSNDLITTTNIGKGGTRTLTMTGGTGDDTLVCSTLDDYVNGEVILFGAGGGHDLILNFRSDDSLYITDQTLDAYYIDGDDLIVSLQSSDDVTLRGASHVNSAIYVTNLLSSSIKLHGSEHDDTITNSNAGALIHAKEGNDYISNSGANSTIDAGKSGNDSIKNYGMKTMINANVGNDSIDNYAVSVTINAGDGNNKIYNGGANSTITAADGNNTIINEFYSPHYGQYNYASLTMINLGDGDNYVSNYSPNVTINTGAGNNSISNTSSEVTIHTGAGADSVRNGGLIDVGEGDDTVDGGLTVRGGSGNDLIKSALTVFGNEGADTISGGHYVEGGNGDDLISYALTIYGGTGNDTIYSSNSYVNGGYVEGGEGDDLLTGGKTILGGAGNDTITSGNNSMKYVYADGGTGNDSISYIATVNGGTGDDTLDHINLLQYANGDGNDLIIGSRPTLQIFSGTIDPIKRIDGSDLSMRIGDSSIKIRDYINRNYEQTPTLLNAEGNSIANPFATILGSDNAEYIANDEVTFVSAGGGNDTIYNSVSGAILYAGDGGNYVSNSARNVSIHAGADNDTVYSSEDGVSLDAGAGDDYFTTSRFLSDSLYLDMGAGNDSVENVGSNATILLGFGDDSVYSYHGENALIYAEGGNNYINVTGDNSTIIALDGDDNAYFSGATNVIISLGDGNNNVWAGSYSTVFSGDGDDVINASINAWISVEGGDNRINTGSHSTIYASDGIDSIYGAYNSWIDGGASDDSIFAYNDSTIYGGDGDDTLLGGTNASIDGGYGNDSISVGSNSTVYGGAGDDTVYLGFDRWSGSGAHYYYSDGNDVILNYNQYYSRIHFTEGQINGAYTDGDDMVIQIGSGSLRFADASDTTINVIDPQDQVYQIYDLPSINNPVKPTGNQPVDANQSSLDDQTITGTDRNDSIASGGNNVLIIALDGDDTIQNYYFDSRHTLNANNPYGIYTGDNVTINAGRGNDLIIGNSSRHEIYQYASGDGDDTISGYNPAFLTSSINANGSLDTMRHDGDIINITEGRLLRASLDGSDVVMIVGTGSMRLTDVKGKEITVVEDEGATFTFTNKYTRQPYVRYVGANVHMMATHDEGESVVAANGTAFIDTYHLLDTDANGNINRLVMTNREYKMTTPDSPIAVNVEGANTQNMAVVIGTADFSWTGERLNIVAASDNPISVDVESNTVTVRGSIGNDSLKSSGHSVTLEGDDGDDTLVGGASADTFVYALGDGNDVIVNYDATDLIRLRSGRIDSAKLDENDVVMSLDGGSIRLKDAKGKDITFIGTNGKEKSFKNNYRGASDEMLSSAKDFLDRLENGLAAKLKEKASRFKPKEELFAELKGQLNMDSSIPDKVYKEIVEAIADKLKTTRAASSWTYTANDEQEFVEEIYSELESGLSNIPSRSVTVDGVVYKISFPLTLSFAGYSSNFIDVEHGGKTEHLSFSTKDKQAIADYNTKLIVLECEVGIDMYKDILGLIVGNSKLMEGILTSGQEEALSMLKKVFGNDVLKEALIPDLNWKELGKKVIRLLDDGKKIISAAETIEEMKRAYDDMEEQADYDSFIRLGNSIAKTLGVEKVSTGGIGDWISGWFNELPASDADYWFTQSDTTSDISALDSIIDNGMPDNKNAVANQLIRTTAENIFPVRETVSIEGLRHKKSYGAK